MCECYITGMLSSSLEPSLAAIQVAIRAGQLPQAHTLACALVQQNPTNADGWNLLGITQRRMGQFQQAEASFRRALHIEPNTIRVSYNLAQLYAQQQRHDDALHILQAIVKDAPEYLPARMQYAAQLAMLAHHAEAITEYLSLVEQYPARVECWQGLRDALPHVAIDAMPQEFTAILARALSLPFAPPKHVYPLALYVMEHGAVAGARVLHIKRAALAEDMPALQALWEDGTIAAWLLHPVMRAWLVHHVVVYPYVERMLRAVREAGAPLWLRGGDASAHAHTTMPDGEHWQALCVLARHAIMHERIHTMREGDQQALAQLTEALQHPNPQSPSFWWQLVAYACYKPLLTLPYDEGQWQEISIHAPSAAAVILREDVEQPLQERKLAEDLQGFGSMHSDSSSAVADATSQKVRAQYETHPYPRWSHVMLGARGTVAAIMRDKMPHIKPQSIQMPASPRVLIAGCGTGRHALLSAHHYADASITAVDISRRSLAYAARKLKDQPHLSVRLLHGDILDLEDLNERFDVIESAGVLHHMQDPLQGWGVLERILNPGGLMRIALYSRIAREAYMQLPALRALAPDAYHTDDALHRLRYQLLCDPTAMQRYPAMHMRDFYTLSECRDLVFHQMEHCFTLPEIDQCLRVLGLELLGMEAVKPDLRGQYLAQHPEDGGLQNILQLHAFEQKHPHMFTGMYQFWAKKISISR